MIKSITRPKMPTRNPRTRQPPQPLRQSDATDPPAMGGCIGGCTGRARRVCAPCTFRGRLGESYATGDTRVPSMSSSSTRRGSGMLFSSRSMRGGGGVRWAGVAFVVAFGSTFSSSFGSIGASARVSASDSRSRFKNRLFSSYLLLSSSLVIKFHQLRLQTLRVFAGKRDSDVSRRRT